MSRSIVFKILVVFIFLMPSSAYSQPSECLGNGRPGGNSWSICIHPWSPQEHIDFGLNFSGLACTPYVNDQFDIQRFGNVYSIYYDYVMPAGCFGVPSSPRLLTTQAGLPAGHYTVRLFQRQTPSLPFPPFDPSAFTLEREVDFTVRGTPQVTPVPLGGPLTWVAAVLGLLVLAASRFRSSRSGA